MTIDRLFNHLVATDILRCAIDNEMHQLKAREYDIYCLSMYTSSKSLIKKLRFRDIKTRYNTDNKSRLEKYALIRQAIRDDDVETVTQYVKVGQDSLHKIR